MAIEIEYKSADNYMLVRVDGVLGDQAYSQVIGEVTSSKEYSTDVNTIWDLRKMDFSGVDEKQERSFISIREKKDVKRGSSKVVCSWLMTLHME